MPKVAVEKIKAGDYVGTPGDKKVRTVWGCVSKVEKSGNLIIFESRDWATESSKKFGSGVGVYTARKGEKLLVKPGACKVK